MYAHLEEIERDDSTNKMRTMDVDDDTLEIVDVSKPSTRYVVRGQRSVSLQRGRSLSRAAAVCLALLCVLLLAGITAQSLRYREVRASLTEERDQLQTSYKNVTNERDQLQTNYNNLEAERGQLETNYNNLKAERGQLETSYKNVTNERDQLQAEVERLNVTPRATCGQGWRKFGCSCYYVSTEKKTWEESRQFCRENGGDLVVINSKEEQTFINSLIGGSSRAEPWIGLTDREREGTWTWVDGTPLTTSFWEEGRSDGYKGRDQDCVEFWPRRSGQPVWNDDQCSVENEWICKK